MSSFASADLGDGADFAALLDDVAAAIAGTMPAWRVQLGDAVARWRGEGVATEVLERALSLHVAPDVDALLATFEAAVARLRQLERDAAALDPAAAGADCFRDPARVREAAAHVAQLRTRAARAVVVRPDRERWMLDWPDVDALLVEEWT